MPKLTEVDPIEFAKLDWEERKTYEFPDGHTIEYYLETGEGDDIEDFMDIYGEYEEITGQAFVPQCTPGAYNLIPIFMAKNPGREPKEVVIEYLKDLLANYKPTDPMLDSEFFIQDTKEEIRKSIDEINEMF